MRTVLLGFVMVLTVSSAAVAKDFIVVSSGDPSVKVGSRWTLALAYPWVLVTR